MNRTYIIAIGLVLSAKFSNAQVLDTTNHIGHSQDTSVLGLHKDSVNLAADTATKIIDTLPDENIHLKGPLNTVGRFGDAIVYTWASPLRWKKKDWLTVGAIAGTTALLFLVDKPVNDFLGRQNGGAMHTIERIGYHAGKPYAAFISMGGFYAAGLLFKSEWAKETALILGSSYASSGALQSIIKPFAGRARPVVGVGNLHFKPFSSDPGYHSFPSGHMQIAMTTATVLASRVKNPYLQTLFYATAATTFISRMNSHSHWISDLFVGGISSWYIAKANIKRWKMTSHQAAFTDLLEKKPKVDWRMGATNDGIGLIAHFN